MQLVITPRFIRKARLVGLRTVFILIAVALLLKKPLWDDPSAIHAMLDTLGALLLVAGVLGRVWCTLYIAGKKSLQLVTTGPYALCRNPLYFFSFLICFGMSLIFQNAAVFILFGIFFLLLHMMAINLEERNLREIFGEEYVTYCRQVPRIIPSLHNWRVAFDRQGFEISKRHLARTVLDCAGYLLALPFAELLEYCFRNGILPLV